MDDNRVLLQQAVAEFIGPFALTFLGAGSIIMTGGQDLVAIALAQGLAIGIMVAAAGHISGGFYNPTLTVGAAIAGKLTPAMSVPLHNNVITMCSWPDDSLHTAINCKAQANRRG